MPEHTFTGLVPTAYPDSKDAAGAPVGTAEPGAVLDLDGPLDSGWQPVRAAAVKPKDKAAPGTDTAAVTGSKEN